jgi:hypothetical protein
MNKTQLTSDTPQEFADFINSIQDESRQYDCLQLHSMLAEITDKQPKMWGNMVGYGEYHYVYESGREGDAFRIGFANRKQALTVYIMPGYDDLKSYLDKLGKYKIGKSCLYIKRLEDIDTAVLHEIMVYAWNYMQTKYPE